MRRLLIVGASALILFGCSTPTPATTAAPTPKPVEKPAPVDSPKLEPTTPATPAAPTPKPAKTPAPVDSFGFNPGMLGGLMKAGRSTQPRAVTPNAARPVLLVPVYYATDRSVDSKQSGPERYDGSLATNLEFGKVVVSVPVKAHKVGEIERPLKLLGFQIGQQDPNKHFVIVQLAPMSFSGWTLASRVQVSGSQNKQALVYIHGFKKNFEDAAYRTAQLGVDLQLGRESLFMFSWPSKNSVNGYASDEETVKLCVADLNTFLTAVLDSTGARRVSIIAHSMGSRLLASVLQEFKAHPPAHMPTEVVFAAPDINAEEFRRVIEPNIRGTTGRLTVYTTERDQALRISKQQHGYHRLGEGGPAVFGLAGFDKIDVTDVDLDLLGHGYYAETQGVLDDIRTVLLSSLEPEKRKLAPYGQFPRTWRLRTQ